MAVHSTASRPTLTSSDVAKVFSHCYGLIESGRAARVQRALHDGILTVAVIDPKGRAAYSVGRTRRGYVLYRADGAELATSRNLPTVLKRLR